MSDQADFPPSIKILLALKATNAREIDPNYKDLLYPETLGHLLHRHRINAKELIFILGRKYKDRSYINAVKQMAISQTLLNDDLMILHDALERLEEREKKYLHASGKISGSSKSLKSIIALGRDLRKVRQTVEKAKAILMERQDRLGNITSLLKTEAEHDFGKAGKISPIGPFCIYVEALLRALFPDLKPNKVTKWVEEFIIAHHEHFDEIQRSFDEVFFSRTKVALRKTIRESKSKFRRAFQDKRPSHRRLIKLFESCLDTIPPLRALLEIQDKHDPTKSKDSELA